MKFSKALLGKRISLCLIGIVTWLLPWKVESAFSLLQAATPRLTIIRRRTYSESNAKTLTIRPCTNVQHRWQPTTQYSNNILAVRTKNFASKNGFFVSPNETSMYEGGKHDNVKNLSKVTTGTSSIHIEYTNRNSGCVIELVEPETNCTVRIIGVFHGSQSSSKDVMQCISSSTDIVVLELCSDRYRDLIVKKSPDTLQNKRPSGSGRGELISDEEESEVGETSTKSFTSHISSRSWFEQYIRVVRDTIDRQGWRTGMVVAIFGLVNGFQEHILQLQPGLEFVTASEISSNFSIPIILADQDVAVTLQRIGQIPHITYELWHNFIQERSWGTTFGPLAYAFSLAIFGDWIDNDDNQNPKLLSLPQFLLRSIDAIQDLLRFLGLPLFMIQALNTMLSIQDSQSAMNTAVAELSVQQDDVFITASINMLVILLFYLCVALPATQVILIERDDVLATGIRTACRLANGKYNFGRSNERIASNSILVRKSEENFVTHQNAEVVVVLGLLHVNGVALRLSQHFDQKLKE